MGDSGVGGALAATVHEERSESQAVVVLWTVECILNSLLISLLVA